MTLEPASAQWAAYQLASEAAELRKRAVALRSQGRRHIPLKNAAQTAAEAIDRAAIELERASKSINQGATHESPSSVI